MTHLRVLFLVSASVKQHLFGGQRCKYLALLASGSGQNSTSLHGERETSFYLRRLCWNRSNACFPCI